jgi:hypothetical protein
MDTRIYFTDINVLLKTVGSPDCKISVGGKTQEIIISNETWINFKLDSVGPQTLLIEHRNKKDSDPTTALIIDQIQFNELTSPKFVWAGIYRPNYPKHLSGDLELKYYNYLSWNGVWSLDFTLPIYTWIHKVEDLGWIYD